MVAQVITIDTSDCVFQSTKDDVKARIEAWSPVRLVHADALSGDVESRLVAADVRRKEQLDQKVQAAKRENRSAQVQSQTLQQLLQLAEALQGKNKEAEKRAEDAKLKQVECARAATQQAMQKAVDAKMQQREAVVTKRQDIKEKHAQAERRVRARLQERVDKARVVVAKVDTVRHKIELEHEQAILEKQQKANRRIIEAEERVRTNRKLVQEKAARMSLSPRVVEARASIHDELVRKHVEIYNKHQRALERAMEARRLVEEKARAKSPRNSPKAHGDRAHIAALPNTTLASKLDQKLEAAEKRAKHSPKVLKAKKIVERSRMKMQQIREQHEGELRERALKFDQKIQDAEHRKEQHISSVVSKAKASTLKAKNAAETVARQDKEQRAEMRQKLDDRLSNAEQRAIEHRSEKQRKAAASPRRGSSPRFSAEY